MDLRQLRYFIALTEHRSFVRAADAMGITQPAFSRSIQGLEQEFGCVLIDRGNKDLRPTPKARWCCNTPCAWCKAQRSSTARCSR